MILHESTTSLRTPSTRRSMFHSINKSGLPGAPTKKRAGEVRSDPPGAAKRFLENYRGSVSHEVVWTPCCWETLTIGRLPIPVPLRPTNPAKRGEDVIDALRKLVSDIKG